MDNNQILSVKDEFDLKEGTVRINKKKGLFSILENLKKLQDAAPHDKWTNTSEEHELADEEFQDKSSGIGYYGETTTNAAADALEGVGTGGGAGGAAGISTTSPSKSSSRKRRMDRSIINSGLSLSNSDFSLNNNNNNNNTNNNNHVKNERLSPGTPDTSSRSRSVTPSSANETPPTVADPLIGRNYSDFMRSLAAKYNNSHPNDYFTRNGFPPPLDPRFKPFAPLIPNLNKDTPEKKTDFSSVLNPFTGAMFPPLIDMSSTQTLLAMVRSAKEAELQNLLKTSSKRPEPSSPLDLSSAAASPSTAIGGPPLKKPKLSPSPIKASISSSSSSSPNSVIQPLKSASPKLEDVSGWSVEDVCNFVSSIDICAEYAQTFRDQSIDGAGLPLLTEEHLTTTMNMKLGPALKLRSILAKKLGSCNVCLHCSHCHNGTSPEPMSSNVHASHSSANSLDSGGAT